MRIRRPRLAAGVLSGILTYIILLIGSSVSGRLRFFICWDVGIFIAMMALYLGLRNATTDWMKRIAPHQDAGKWVVLILALVAAGASLIAIAQQIPLVKNASDFYERVSHLCFIIATIVLSWSFVHTMFALQPACVRRSCRSRRNVSFSLGETSKTRPSLYSIRNLSKDRAGLEVRARVGVIERISRIGIVQRDGPLRTKRRVPSIV
jgi:uncharacterized membrane protein